MKKIIYGLLIAAPITGSAVYGSQQPPQRPATSLPTPLKTDNSVCPDELNMTQLTELKGGHLKLGSSNFKVHTAKPDFDAMLPGKMQVISKGLSVAKIAPNGRAIISTPEGHILKCTYTFRTALGSKTGQAPKTFAITSEPAQGKSLPSALTEAVLGS